MSEPGIGAATIGGELEDLGASNAGCSVLVESRSWREDTGWSEPLPSDLDSEQTLAIVFGDPALLSDPAPITDLRERFPRAHVVRCSTAGQIKGSELAESVLVVAIARFEHTRIATAITAVEGTPDSRDAGKRVATALASPDLRALLVLSDGLHVNGSELVRGLAEGVGDGVVVTGGLAGDKDRFERTWVVADGEPAEVSVAGVGLYGDRVVIGAGSFGGFDPFGPERRVTRSEGNVLYELDGKPALALYKEYLGDRAAELPGAALHFPLAVRPARDDSGQTVRCISGVDEQEQSITFSGDVPEGWLAQLMRANKNRLVDGAMQAAAMGSAGDHVGEQLAVVVSCVGRRLVLGERTEEEIEAAREALAPGAHLVGFYSYGEIAPVAGSPCELHNQTMTVTTFAEIAP
jgi:hypothetical protein